MKSDVSLEYKFTNSIENVWNALTDSETLAKWIMENDFKPIVGHKFQFRTEPNEWWNGIVDCEVLVVEEPYRLSYIWASAGETTTVTWTLKEVSEGTVQLNLDQTGFSEETKARVGAIEGATHAWTNMGNQLGKVLSEL